ncbi:MAG TPA: M48 family metalloprotease [Devosiaceae bacterium]|nr:M48 family metalloprotease [Devosiaceae bacterium]
MLCGTFRGLRTGLLIAVLLPLAGCVGFADPSSFNSNANSAQTSPVDAPTGEDAEDAVIGKREHPRIIATYGGIYNDPAAEIMIAHIVGRLLTAAGQPNTQYTVTILDTADVNAFALPGGYIYVTRGILALANDNSEIAAVLAHEIAHVVLHHARARSNMIRDDQMVDKVMTGVLAPADAQALEEKSRLSLAAFSQQQELQADHKGIEIAGTAGYDAFAAARFLSSMGRFSKFSVGDATQADDFLSSHPSTPDRIQRATALAQSEFGDKPGEHDRDGYLAAIDGMSFGASPQQGAIIGQRYIQPALKFTFVVPNGYTLQNAQSAVVGVAGDSEAVRFDSAEVPASMALTDYLKSGWIAGLDPASVTEATVNGMDTASGIAKTAQWSFRVSVARFQGQVVRFIFAAKADSPRFDFGADATLRSFRPTTTADLAQIRSVSLKVIVAKPGDTAQKLAQRMASMSRGVELFYILNNLLPGDPVTPGQKYKVIEVS